MKTETIQQENVIADTHLPTEGAKNPLIISGNTILDVKPIVTFKGNRYKIKLYCKECGELITDFKSLDKKFCDVCYKKHRTNNAKNWRNNNKDKYKKMESKRLKYKRELRWKKADNQGIFVEHRTEIKNCVLCNRDISMLHSISKFCCHCAEKQNSRGSINAIGTTDARQHMIRKYDHRIGKVVPNFKSELMFLVKERRTLGLPKNKELNKIEFDNYYPGWNDV